MTWEYTCLPITQVEKIISAFPTTSCEFDRSVEFGIMGAECRCNYDLGRYAFFGADDRRTRG